jgi:hypothetical protein
MRRPVARGPSNRYHRVVRHRSISILLLSAFAAAQMTSGLCLAGAGADPSDSLAHAHGTPSFEHAGEHAGDHTSGSRSALHADDTIIDGDRDTGPPDPACMNLNRCHSVALPIAARQTGIGLPLHDGVAPRLPRIGLFVAPEPTTPPPRAIS